MTKYYINYVNIADKFYNYEYGLPQAGDYTFAVNQYFGLFVDSTKLYSNYRPPEVITFGSKFVFQNYETSISCPIGYEFDKWTIYKRQANILTQSYDYSLTEIVNNEIWDNTYDLYIFATYKPKLYTVRVHEMKSNLIKDISTDSANYVNVSSFNLYFNQYFTVPDYTLNGYTTLGYYADNHEQTIPSLLSSQITNELFCSRYVNAPYDTQVITAGEIDSKFLQQTWNVGNTFYFRPAECYVTVSDGVNYIDIYTIYTVDNYSIYYFEPISNAVENEGNSINYLKTFENTSNFNAEYAVYTAKRYDGYNFIGWFVTTSNYDGGSIFIYNKGTGNKYDDAIFRDFINSLETTPTNYINGLVRDVLHNDEYSSVANPSGADYYQNWEVGNSFNFRYTTDVYCYAVYQPIEYVIHYYDSLSNGFDNVNFADTYENAVNYTATFNVKFSYANSIINGYNFNFHHDSDVYGYNLVGFYVSDKVLTAPAGSHIPLNASMVTSSYISSSNKYGGTIVNMPYDDAIYGSNRDYLQNWIKGNSFLFRYLSDIYVYAIYETKEYTIHYYMPDNNYVGYVNNTSQYHSHEDVKALFNQNFTTHTDADVVGEREKDSPLYGYTFVGWFISEKNPFAENVILSTVTTASDVGSFYVKNPITKEHEIQNFTYEINWAKGETFIWRYSTDVYAYAYFIPNEYNVHFMVPTNNNADTIINDARGENYTDARTESITFNTLMSWGDTGLLINRTTIIGYTFMGWFISEESPYTSTFNKPTSTYIASYDSSDRVLLDNVPIYYQDYNLDSVDFRFRYAKTIYAYAVFSKPKTNIHYYNALDNFVGTLDNSSNYTRLVKEEQVEFNQMYTPYHMNQDITSPMRGYKWLGWLVLTERIAPNVQILTPTSIHLQKSSTKDILFNNGMFSYTNKNDNTITNVEGYDYNVYLQNWNTVWEEDPTNPLKVTGSAFAFRYGVENGVVSDLYCYAVYEEMLEVLVNG